MSNQQEPLKIEIPVEEENAKPESGVADVASELRNLGKQFANTLQTAWNSSERQKMEGEIKEGLKFFADEVGKVFNEVKESPAAQKVREEASEIRTKVDGSDLGKKAREGMAQGLGWLSRELSKLAERFTSPESTHEKSPDDIK